MKLFYIVNLRYFRVSNETNHFLQKIQYVAYTAATRRRICGSGSSVPVHKALAYTLHFIIDNFTAQ